eukprot:3531928-Pyramimonas_sp.AAC.1
MSAERLREAEVKGIRFMSFCMRVAEHQMVRSRGFLLEHPVGACSWELASVREILSRPGVVSGVAGLCQYGLRSGGGAEQEAHQMSYESPFAVETPP